MTCKPAGAELDTGTLGCVRANTPERAALPLTPALWPSVPPAAPIGLALWLAAGDRPPGGLDSCTSPSLSAAPACTNEGPAELLPRSTSSSSSSADVHLLPYSWLLKAPTENDECALSVPSPFRLGMGRRGLEPRRGSPDLEESCSLPPLWVSPGIGSDSLPSSSGRIGATRDPVLLPCCSVPGCNGVPRLLSDTSGMGVCIVMNLRVLARTGWGFGLSGLLP